MKVKQDTLYLTSSHLDCPICGISTFDHVHRKGTLPKEVEPTLGTHFEVHIVMEPMQKQPGKPVTKKNTGNLGTSPSFIEEKIVYIAIIEENPKVMGGQPVLKGTRLPLSRLASRGFKEFIKDYPITKQTGNWWKESLYETNT